MVRILAISGVLSCIAALLLAWLPNAWDKAEDKAAADAAELAQLATQPDRIGLRLSEHISLTRAMLWDAEGQQQYPPPGGLVPLPFTFSEDATRNLTQKQQASERANWSMFDPTGAKLLYCDAAPPVCLIYDRRLLEDTLGLADGALAGPTGGRLIATLLALLAGCFLLVSAWMARARSRSNTDYEIGPSLHSGERLEIIPERHLAKRGALEIALTPRDLKILAILEMRDGAVVTKDELYDAGWGRDYMPNSRALDQHIINLRRKLDPQQTLPVVIETVRGVGYRMVT